MPKRPVSTDLEPRLCCNTLSSLTWTKDVCGGNANVCQSGAPRICPTTKVVRKRECIIFHPACSNKAMPIKVLRLAPKPGLHERHQLIWLSQSKTQNCQVVESGRIRRKIALATLSRTGITLNKANWQSPMNDRTVLEAMHFGWPLCWIERSILLLSYSLSHSFKTLVAWIWKGFNHGSFWYLHCPTWSSALAATTTISTTCCS